MEKMVKKVYTYPRIEVTRVAAAGVLLTSSGGTPGIGGGQSGADQGGARAPWVFR